MYGKDESVPKTNIIKPTSGKYGSNSSFFFYESKIYFLTSVRRAFMDAHLFKEIEETLQSDGVGASWCWGESHTVARRIILDLRRRRSRNSRRVAKSRKWMSKCCRKMDRRKYFKRSYSCMDQREIEKRNKMIHRRSSKLVFFCRMSGHTDGCCQK